MTALNNYIEKATKQPNDDDKMETSIIQKGFGAAASTELRSNHLRAT